MMKKAIFLLAALLMSLGLQAQTNPTNLDFEEDTTQVVSISEILQMQEMAYSKKYRTEVISSVWKPRAYLTLSYASTSLKGKSLMMYDPTTKTETKQSPTYTTNWGLSLKRSTIFPFHKKPISNLVSFGLYFTGLDLSVNHYCEDSLMRYDSRHTFRVEDSVDEYQYVPWGSEMYSFAYAMHLGPAITVAPLTPLENVQAAHLRLQAYFTIGYRIGLFWMRGNDQQDLNLLAKTENNAENSYEETYFERVSGSSKILWGHGLTTNWGLRISWRNIGLGYEVIHGNYTIKSAEKKIYGNEKFKFSETSKRVTLSYIW